MVRALLGWSGGKDCAWALHVLRASGVEVAALLSTLDRATRRVSMHAVRGELIEAQAAALGLPLWTVPLPWPCPNAEYETAMADVCRKALAAGIDHVAFGDLHLEDVRAYREQRLAGTGMRALFPLWGRAPEALGREMIAGGLQARVITVDTAAVPREILGCNYDEALLDRLAEADPCGEYGEFHTFVYGGPMFRTPVSVKAGAVRDEGRFLYLDLLPA